MRAGVLALQGDFAAHAAALRAVGASVAEVRRADAIDDLDVLVIPGGESTTSLRLLSSAPAGGADFEPAVRRLLDRGGAVFGTCAGAILLAKRVTSPEQPSWGLLDVDIERNAFGRQVASFEAMLDTDGDADRAGGGAPYEALFIRAPRIRRVGPGVEVLARWKGEPVLVRQGRVFAATFHPELTADRRIHGLVVGSAGVAAAARG